MSTIALNFAVPFLPAVPVGGPVILVAPLARPFNPQPDPPRMGR